MSLGGQAGGWIQRCPAVSRSALVVDPRDEAVLLLAQGPGGFQRELWRWTGEAFERERSGLFPALRRQEHLFGVLASADPVAGDVLLCGQTARGLVATGRAEDAATRELVLPDDEHHGRDLIGVFRLGPDLVILARDGTVYADRDGALVRVAEPLPGDTRLTCAAVDPDRGLLVAGFGERLSSDGGCRVFAPGTGWGAGTAREAEVCDLAWNPWRRRVEALCERDYLLDLHLMTDDGELPPQSWLTAWDTEGLGRAKPTLGGGAGQRLVADRPGGRWLAVDRHALVLAAEPDGDAFEPLPDPWLRGQVGWESLLLHPAHGPLRARGLGTWAGLCRLDADGWTEIAPAQLWIDRRSHTAAAPDGFFVLDGDGALHFLADDGTSRRLAPQWGGLAGLDAPAGNHDGDQVSLVHDAPRDRLVLWIGSNRQTWTFRGERWTRLTATARPPVGTARLCVTDAGVYGLVGAELWLLHGDRWSPVGADPKWTGVLLFSRTGRPGLWSVSDEQIGVWRQGRFEAVAGLPPGVVPSRGPSWAEARSYGGFSGVGYDPADDRLVAFGEAGVWELPLDALTAPAAEVPIGAGTARDDDVEPVPEHEPGSFSTYLLEHSVAPGAARQGDVHAATSLDGLADIVEDRFNSVFDDDAGLDPEEQIGVLEEILWDWTLHLWVVQRGILSQGIDLRPYLVARYDDGIRIGLGPERHELLRELVDAGRYPIGYTVDRAALAAAAPALQPPLLDGARLLVLRFDGPRPDPDVFTYLRHGQRLHRGYQDLEGNVGGDELREFDDLADLPGGLDEIDDLTEDELRTRGWEL